MLRLFWWLFVGTNFSEYKNKPDCNENGHCWDEVESLPLRDDAAAGDSSPLGPNVGKVWILRCNKCGEMTNHYTYTDGRAAGDEA